MTQSYKKNNLIKSTRHGVRLKKQLKELAVKSSTATKVSPAGRSTPPVDEAEKGIRARGSVTMFELMVPLSPETRTAGQLVRLDEEEVTINSTESYRKGATLNMHFSLTYMRANEKEERDPETPFHAIGKVVDCTPMETDTSRYRVTIKFTDIFEEERSFLRQYIDTRSTQNGKK